MRFDSIMKWYFQYKYSSGKLVWNVGMLNSYAIQLGMDNATFTIEIPRVKKRTPENRNTVTAKCES